MHLTIVSTIAQDLKPRSVVLVSKPDELEPFSAHDLSIHTVDEIESLANGKIRVGLQAALTGDIRDHYVAPEAAFNVIQPS